MITKYYANGTTYTFEITETYDTRCGVIAYGKCRENGKSAWIDNKGIQFVGEERFEAHKLEETHFPAGCQMWGGEIRDALPNGSRFYFNGGTK